MLLISRSGAAGYPGICERAGMTMPLVHVCVCSLNLQYSISYLYNIKKNLM